MCFSLWIAGGLTLLADASLISMWLAIRLAYHHEQEVHRLEARMLEREDAPIRVPTPLLRDLLEAVSERGGPELSLEVLGTGTHYTVHETSGGGQVRRFASSSGQEIYAYLLGTLHWFSVVATPAEGRK
jgi:hypothetical protein